MESVEKLVELQNVHTRAPRNPNCGGSVACWTRVATFCAETWFAKSLTWSLKKSTCSFTH